MTRSHPNQRPIGLLVTSFLVSILAIGPAGCQSFNVAELLPAASGSGQYGFLINSNADSGVLGGVRLADGSEVFVYGTYPDDGGVPDIRGAVLRDASGREASLTFESGRLVHAESFDGSTLDFTYEEVSALRIRGHVKIYFAAAAEGERTQTLPFDVDLTLAAAELAQQVEDVLGISVMTVEPPAAPNARIMKADAFPLPATSHDKRDATSQFMFSVVVFSYQYAVASLGFCCVQVVTQTVAGILEAVVDMVSSLTTTIVVSICSPFVMMGEMMRMAMFQPTIIIDFEMDLDPAIGGIPHSPCQW